MPARSEPYEAPAVITFAKELEWRRTKAELTKKDLAIKLGFADSYVGQVELCKNLPSEDFADALDTFFKADGLFHRLWERINETKNTVALPPGFSQYVRLEDEAAEIHKFDALIVTGLLQTADYAREVLLTVQQPDAIQPMLDKRLGRQEILTRENAPRLFIVHDERALRTVIGDKDIMRDQLRHLLEMGRHPNIQHQVVPQTTGAYAGIEGSLTLLKFEDGHEAAYVEPQGQGQLILDPVRVTNCAVRYQLLRGYALPVPDTQQLVESILEGL